MTVLIGYCMANGAFVAADGRRTILNQDGTCEFADQTIKVSRLTKTSFIASAGHGSFGDHIRGLASYIVGLNDPLVSALEQAALVRRLASAAQIEFDNLHPTNKLTNRFFVGGCDQTSGTGFLWDMSSTEEYLPVSVTAGQMTFAGPDPETIHDYAAMWLKTHPLSNNPAILSQRAREIIRWASGQWKEVGGTVCCGLASPNGLNFDFFDPLP